MSDYAIHEICQTAKEIVGVALLVLILLHRRRKDVG